MAHEPPENNEPPANAVSAPRFYVDSLHRDLTGQVERRIQTQQRELHDAVEHLTALIKAESRLRESFIEEYRITNKIASDERDKAAAQLRVELLRSTTEGDDGLRKHIEQQYKQIEAALISAELLEVERLDHAKEQIESLGKILGAHIEGMGDRAETIETQIRLVADSATEARDTSDKRSEERLDAVRRELLLVSEAAKEAVQKAETATERRFESVNEFRANLADQSASFLPREVAENSFRDLRTQTQELTNRLNRAQGVGEGGKELATVQRAQIGLMIALGSTVVAVIVVIVNVITSR